MLNRSIDSVIKKVSSSYRASGNNEEIFIVNTKTGKIIETALFWQSLEYYLVSFSNFAECKNLIHRVSDFRSQAFIDLSLDYKISCNRENARQTVLALHSTSPLEELERKIKIWIDQYLGENIYNFVSNIDVCFSSIRQIQEQLQQKVKAETGLNFELIVSIVDISNFRPFSIEFSGLGCSISDFSSNRNLNITIDYRATCDSNNIKQAALALYSNTSPTNILSAKIQRWVKEFSENKTAQIIDNFDIEIENLRINLRNRAKEEVGLNFEARISSNFQQVGRLDSEQLKPYNTGSLTLPIRIADYDQELELQLEAILEVDIENRDSAFRNRGREVLLLTTIKEEINKYFLQNVNLHKFFSELQYSIHQEINSSLNRVLIDKGRKIAYLSLTSNSIDQIKNRFSLTQSLEIKDYQIECLLQEIKETIQVKNFIKLQLIDLSMYRTAVANQLIPLNEYGKPNLERWVKERLAQEINSILPNETFADLLSEFEPIITNANNEGLLEDKSNHYSQKIFNAIDSESRLIGYSVTRLISEPELQVRERWNLQDFLEIKDFLINCLLKDFEEPIPVKNTLQLQIVDVRKYSIAINTKQIPLSYEDGKPNLEIWARQSLEKIVKSLLLKTEYIDLLPEQNKEVYSQQVAAEIQKAASTIGYEVVQIISIPEAEVREKLGFKDFLEVNDYPISCAVKGFDKQIIVRNTLHLHNVNVQKYSAAIKNKQIPINDQDKKPSLEMWAKQNIEKIVKLLLLKTEYIDLIPEEGVQKYGSEVLTEIQKAAGEIGYEVTQIITIPELEQVRAYAEIFDVEIDEQEYPTKDANCPVKLIANVVMRIENLQSIGKLLRSSENDLKTQIKNRIKESISRVINGIEPERFFMRFDSFDAQVRGETKSVEKILSDAIEQELKEHFQAVVISTTLKIVDTDLIKLFRALQGKNSHFEIEFEPTSGDVEKVTFTGKFQVLSVGDNDWNKFQTKFRAALTKREELLKVIAELEEQRMQLERQTFVDPKETTKLNQRIESLEAKACGIDLIRQNIESDFRPLLRRYTGDEFRNSSIQDLMKLEENLNNWLKKGKGSIRDLYGLEAEVSQLDCPITESEENKADKQFAITEIREEIDFNEQQVVILRQQIIELTPHIGTGDHIQKEIDTKKNSLQILRSEIKKLTLQLQEEKKLQINVETQKGLTGGLEIPSERFLLQKSQETEPESNQSPITSYPNFQELEAEPIEVKAQPVDNDSKQ